LGGSPVSHGTETFLGPPDVNEAGHLREAKLLLAVLFSDIEGSAGVSSHLAALFRFKQQVLRLTFEEVGARLVEIPEALLKHARADVLTTRFCPSCFFSISRDERSANGAAPVGRHAGTLHSGDPLTGEGHSDFPDHGFFPIMDSACRLSAPSMQKPTRSGLSGASILTWTIPSHGDFLPERFP
jgi:hypothetical protein